MTFRHPASRPVRVFSPAVRSQIGVAFRPLAARGFCSLYSLTLGGDSGRPAQPPRDCSLVAISPGFTPTTAQGAAMAVERYPLILKDDYNALRSVVPDLPETYEKWIAEVQSKKAKARHSYEAAPGAFQ
jgi:hypothetical protein